MLWPIPRAWNDAPGPQAALSHMISAVWLPESFKIRSDESKVQQLDVGCQPFLGEGVGGEGRCADSNRFRYMMSR